MRCPLQFPTPSRNTCALTLPAAPRTCRIRTRRCNPICIARPPLFPPAACTQASPTSPYTACPQKLSIPDPGCTGMPSSPPVTLPHPIPAPDLPCSLPCILHCCPISAAYTPRIQPNSTSPSSPASILPSADNSPPPRCTCALPTRSGCHNCSA